MHFGNGHNSPTRPITPDEAHHRHFSFKPTWMQKLLSHPIFVRDESHCRSPEDIGNGIDDTSAWPSVLPDKRPKCPPSSKDKERPITGLPRQTTFRRQNSERRERLCPVEHLPEDRRAASASRHVSTSCVGRRRTKSSPPVNPSRVSAPAVAVSTEPPVTDTDPVNASKKMSEHGSPSRHLRNDNVFDYEERPSRSVSRASSVSWSDRAQLQMELDTKWILNLSMHFRDKSDREKFFVTYAEAPTRWRRVTVSCDYRHAEPGSLEMDLRELQFQRDKSLAIYEAVRESLPEIQFYETVTNLKLETSEGRLHVHVTEDVNEIIPYPPRSMVRHILDDTDTDARPMELCENDIAFDTHLSGFVYKIWHRGKTYIKKEIPSPDTIDEFLYEVNALHALTRSDNVIKLEAIILDDTRQLVKGLLISYAERGAIVDILYDNKGFTPWAHRETWGRQAVEGLRDIHEEGYVQGDFTLSNIVVDENNNAKIIDINRRGCPVGWEPPEIAQKIASNQRISMYIGEKSDIFQLGMTLWALAMDDDEPERHDPPLRTADFPVEVPDWFKEVVQTCLSQKPSERLSAKELTKMFPKPSEPDMVAPRPVRISPRPHPLLRDVSKQYIDPDAAVERDDLERFKSQDDLLYSPQSSKDDWTFTYPRSSEYDLDDASSAVEGHRGRNPISRVEREQLTWPQENRLVTELADEPQILDISPDVELEYDELEMDGKPYFVRTGTFNSAELRLLNDNVPDTACLATMTLAPTTINKSPSPFRLPNWQKSLLETTPRNSRVGMPPQSRSDSLEISPRSTLLALPQRSRSADPTLSARSSNETLPGCGVSVGETTFSGTTAFTCHSDYEKSRPKTDHNDNPYASNSFNEPALAPDTTLTMPCT